MRVSKLNYKSNIAILLLMSVCLFSSCKKTEETKTYDTSRDGKDPDLYGTWRTSDKSKEEYFEFVKDSIRSCYWLYKDAVRKKFLASFKVNSNGLTFGGYTYPAYEVKSDKVFLFDKNRKLIDSLIRIDNSVVNYKTWLKPLTVIAGFDVPWQFIPPGSVDPMNFGIDGDTLYYYGNNRYIYKYNPFKNEYYDSISAYTVTSFAFSDPTLYFVSDGKVYKTDRFLKTPAMITSSNPGINTMSYDRGSSTFYYTLSWPGQGLYSGKAGENPVKISSFNLLTSTPDGLQYYKDSKYLEFMSGELHMSLFVSNLNTWQQTYGIPEGFDGIYYISTDGKDTWVVVSNFALNKHKLLKVSLE